MKKHKILISSIMTAVILVGFGFTYNSLPKLMNKLFVDKGIDQLLDNGAYVPGFGNIVKVKDYACWNLLGYDDCDTVLLKRAKKFIAHNSQSTISWVKENKNYFWRELEAKYIERYPNSDPARYIANLKVVARRNINILDVYANASQEDLDKLYNSIKRYDKAEKSYYKSNDENRGINQGRFLLSIQEVYQNVNNIGLPTTYKNYMEHYDENTYWALCLYRNPGSIDLKTQAAYYRDVLKAGL